MDPTGRARLRWWDGVRWTSWIAEGDRSVRDPGSLTPRPVRPDDQAHLAFVREVFLPLARATSGVPVAELDELAEYAWRLEDSVAPVAAGVAASASAPAAQPRAQVVDRAEPLLRTPESIDAMLARHAQVDLTTTTGGVPPQTAARVPEVRVVPTPHEPGPVARWWADAKGQIGSDIATHGLAYLGVLLMFVGAFGLVAFAFGDVAEGMRPVAEISIALVPFLAAWMLLRRKADIVGRALELAGGLLLPVMLITSFLDGVVFPPDVIGVPLVLATTVTTLVVAVLYALWSRRHPESALRFLVAPLVWLAAGLACSGVGRPIPSGSGFAAISAEQVAAITVAMAATLAWARWRPTAALAAPTLTAARIGVGIVGLLAVMTWIGQGGPVVPVLVAGVFGIVSLELIAFGNGYPQLAWWSVTALSLLIVAPESVSYAVVGTVAAIGYLVLLELRGRRALRLQCGLAALGLVGFSVATWSQPWWALGLYVALAVWAGVRRLHPYDFPEAEPLLDLAAGAAPIAAVVSFGVALRDAPLAILVASVLVASSLVILAVPRVRTALSRGERDHFWQTWWDVGMAATVIAIVVMVSAYWPDVVVARWQLALAPAVLAVSAALGPLPKPWRFPPALALLLGSWLIASYVGGWSAVAIAVAPTLVALLLVIGVHVAPSVWARLWDATIVGWSAMALSAASVAIAATAGYGSRTWMLVAAIASLATCLVVTVAFDERSRSPLLAPMPDAALEVVRPAVHGATGAAIAATVVTALDASALVPVDSDWGTASVSALALLGAVATRVRVSAALRRSLAWFAIVASVVAAVLAGTPTTALVGLVVVAAVPLVMAAEVRPRTAVWLAWAAVAPMVGLVALLAVPAYADLAVVEQATIALVSAGGALLVGSLALDLRGRAWDARVRPWHATSLPPAALGALEVLVALLATTAIGSLAGWVTLAVAVVVVAAGLLARLWSSFGVGVLLAWLGWWEIASTGLQVRPWVALLLTVVLLAGAVVAHRLARDLRPWVRGDLPLLVAAHVTAITALWTGADSPWVVLAVGLLSTALAVRLRAMPMALACYGVVGSVLVIAAGALAGPGWLALALLVVSVACSVVATSQRGWMQLGLVLVGSALSFAAWLSFTTWLDLAPQARVDWTAALGAAVVLGGAVLLRWTQVDRLVLLVRLAVAFGAAAVAPIVGSGDDPIAFLSLWTAAALLVTSVAWGIAAPVVRNGSRYVAGVLAFAALIESFVVLEPTATWQLSALAVVAVVAGGLLLVRDLLGEWRGPVAVLGWLGASSALVVAGLELPDTVLVPPALVVAAAFSAAYGVALHQLWARLLAPPLLCAAWVVWAGNALGGNPQWYAVPVGLTVLVLVALMRADARARGAVLDRGLQALMEATGVLLVVGASFVQAFTTSLGYAVLAAFLGGLVAVWGLLTRVRRRLLMGASVVVGALVVLVLIPLAHLLPAWSSATLWVVIGCAGLLALLSATLLEQGRAVVRRGLDDLHRLTDGWE